LGFEPKIFQPETSLSLEAPLPLLSTTPALTPPFSNIVHEQDFIIQRVEALPEQVHLQITFET
jgi:hypothetical protein